MMDLSRKVSLRGHVLSRAIGEETVLMNLATGTYFGLDGIGARIVELLQSGQTLGEVCTAMHELFDASREDIERDVLQLAESLQAQELVDIE